MESFLREVSERPNTGLAAYFPRRGDWTWVVDLRDERGRRLGTGRWRFSGAETVRVLGAGGPVCSSFDTAGGDVGPIEGSFASQLVRATGSWRRVGTSRFVPPGASAGSPVFVKWRREDDAWVVDAFGEEGMHVPGLLAEFASPTRISRDTSLVAEGAGYAAGTEWYASQKPVMLDGGHYVMYGLPCIFPESDVQRLERIGVLGRVSVYAERSDEAVSVPGILYLPVTPGEFQPYVGFGSPPCE